MQYLVRVGLFADIVRLSPATVAAYARGNRVICRTSRGLEVGEILTQAEDEAAHFSEGQLLRRVTVEDDLLLARLEKHRGQAFEACQNLIQVHGIPAILTDVEQLFDGQTICFYFLGDPPPEIEAVTQELADVYETKIEFRKFLNTLTEGCGPGCGTEDAENGCKSGRCSTCVVASACHTRREA